MKMCELTNEQLCRLVKNGDTAAAENLINNNIGFITEIAKAVISEYGMQKSHWTICFRKDKLQSGNVLINSTKALALHF